MPNGNGFQAHVDYHAYSHIGEIAHLTANVAVDEATIANGCLEVVPGSHKSEIEFSNGGRISPSWEESHEWTTVPLKQGDILFFGSHLAHRSKNNTTDRSRTSLYATFYMAKDGHGLRKRYYEHRREVFPPDHGTWDPVRDCLGFASTCMYGEADILCCRARGGQFVSTGLEDVWVCGAVLGC